METGRAIHDSTLGSPAFCTASSVPSPLRYRTVSRSLCHVRAQAFPQMNWANSSRPQYSTPTSPTEATAADSNSIALQYAVSVLVDHGIMLQPEVMPALLDRELGSENIFSKSISMNGNGITKMAAHQLPPLETKINGAASYPSPISPTQDTANGSAIAPVLPYQPLTVSPTSASPRSFEPSLRKIPKQHRRSSPARFSYPPQAPVSETALDSPVQPHPPPLNHRHTLEVPLSAVPRLSYDHYGRPSTESGDTARANGRFSPTMSRSRPSVSLGRRMTRSLHSDLHLEESMPQDEDATRLAEVVKQRRANRRSRRKDEEDDDRVVVGTKVDQNHVNWVTAYNMLTGIRFTVSRTNAKVPPRELTDAHFEARNKFSFDVTGNELTPSAKYDFKFKDYAPEVFRKLRAHFGLDPADYLVSLTSKYILSELGSPGKSGSFFYFSRDYKYIIKTIHHSEHKLLRKVLRQYYDHVLANPNTLLSQFYGLHRVKIPYGRKIHFVVMNNLFPPHRDIHHTFDLKGSTIGREFKEEELERHPRATLKDLNWRRRNMTLEFGPSKKQIFLEQMRKDVALLKKLKIMDYSLLVGIHDLGKGNEENLRDRTLQVYHPATDEADDTAAPLPLLQRTPSKLENARKAKELRQNLKTLKPVPMGRSTSRMPDEMPQAIYENRRKHPFYNDDGGFRATHEDDRPGEEVYYLGIIDCLTRYSLVKRTEHFFKGLVNNEKEISALPPERYGSRFVDFISSTTVPKETAGAEKHEQMTDRVRGTTDSTSFEGAATLPRVEEAGENSVLGERLVASPARDGDPAEEALKERQGRYGTFE